MAAGSSQPVLPVATGRAREGSWSLPIIPAAPTAADTCLTGVPPVVRSEVAAKSTVMETLVVGPAVVTIGVGGSVAGPVAGRRALYRRHVPAVAGTGRVAPLARPARSSATRTSLAKVVMAPEALVPVEHEPVLGAPGFLRGAAIVVAEVNTSRGTMTRTKLTPSTRVPRIRTTGVGVGTCLGTAARPEPRATR